MLSAAPPTASRARAGCHVIRERILTPANCMIAWPNDAQISTTNSAANDTHSAGEASPSSFGASQMPISPPSSSPPVAKAPAMKPCQ